MTLHIRPTLCQPGSTVTLSHYLLLRGRALLRNLLCLRSDALPSLPVPTLKMVTLADR